MISDRPYTFTRVTPQDLPMIRAWLEEPHVRRWWGNPAEQIALIAGDLDEPTMGCYLAAFEGRPFAYVQCWLTHPYSVYLDQPPGTRGIDPFIGVPELVARATARASSAPSPAACWPTAPAASSSIPIRATSRRSAPTRGPGSARSASATPAKAACC